MINVSIKFDSSGVEVEWSDDVTGRVRAAYYPDHPKFDGNQVRFLEELKGYRPSGTWDSFKPVIPNFTNTLNI